MMKQIQIENRIAKQICYPVLIVCFLFKILCIPSEVSGEQVGNDIFLQGNFIELGIHESAYFGSSSAAPAGYHPIGRTTLGFVADIGQDGWTTGTPAQSGDYFLPGGPFEGWGVEWTVSGIETLLKNYGSNNVQIPKTSLTETSAGDTKSAVWIGIASNGTTQKLKIEKTIQFGINDLFFVHDVTLTNVGSVTLQSLEYARSVDPDNDIDIGGSYTTTNTINFQTDESNTKALVVAKGTVFPSVTLGLGTDDSHAKVAYGPGIDPDSILSTSLTVDSTVTTDGYIAIAFRFDDLAPGESVNFQYTYILDENTLDTAMASFAAPITTNLVGDTLSYNQGDGDQIIEQSGDITVSDKNSSDFNTGNLTVSIVSNHDTSEDVLAIRNEGTGSGQIGISGSNVSYGGNVIGTFTGGSGTNNLVITFNSTNATPAATAALIRNITYNNTDTTNPTKATRTVRFTINDGDGLTSSNFDAFVAINPPIITNLNGDTLGYSKEDPASAIEQDNDAVVSDVDNTNFNGGNLTISIIANRDSNDDVLSIQNEGTGTGQIGVSGSNVTYEGTIIGTFTGGSGNSDLVVTFSSNASIAAVQALIRKITYQNTDTTAPTTNARTITFTLNDGTNDSANYYTTVNVSTSSKATISNLAGDTLNYSKGDPASIIDQGSDSIVADTDSSNFNEGNLTISIVTNRDSTEDVLSVKNEGTGSGQIGVSGSIVSYEGTAIGTLTGGNGNNDLIISFNSDSATLAAAQALVRDITYQNTDTSNPSTDARTVSFTLNDGDGGTSANYEVTINVSSIANNAPVINDTSRSIAENANVGDNVGSPVTGTDADSEDTLTYSITAGNDNQDFVINENTGQITVNKTLDRETTDSYSLIVQIYDGTAADTATVAITITDVNDNAPVIGDGTTTSNIINGKYGKAQTFDCQRSPAYPAADSPFTASSFNTPYSNSGQYIMETGQYIQFFYTNETCAQDEVGIKLFNSDGSLDKIIHNGGNIYGL